MEVSLVRELAKHPILYDTTLEEYKHVELKNRAWREITARLFHTTNQTIVERVKNKWKNLRDTFVKSQRKKDRLNSRPWKLEGEMKFLIPHITLKGTQERSGGAGAGTSSILLERLMSSSPDQERKENLGRDEESLLEEWMPVEAVMEESPRIKHPRKRSREPFTHFLDSYPDQQVGVPVEYDHIDSFFLGLAQQVKQLRPLDQVVLKKAISNLVFDTEYKSLESCEASSSS